MAASVRPIGFDEVQGIDHIALGLRHFGALLIADEGVDIDIVEGNLMHEMEAHHHHPGNPEEDDVETGDEHARRITVV
jgi:hypothetical protein